MVSHSRNGNDHSTPLKVAVYMRNPDLRKLVRESLEAEGHDVVWVSPDRPGSDVGADVVVTEELRPNAPVIVWVIDDLTWPRQSIVRLPLTRLDELNDVIKVEGDGRDLPAAGTARAAG